MIISIDSWKEASNYIIVTALIDDALVLHCQDSGEVFVEAMCWAKIDKEPGEQIEPHGRLQWLEDKLIDWRVADWY